MAGHILKVCPARGCGALGEGTRDTHRVSRAVPAHSAWLVGVGSGCRALIEGVLCLKWWCCGEGTRGTRLTEEVPQSACTMEMRRWQKAHTRCALLAVVVLCRRHQGDSPDRGGASVRLHVGDAAVAEGTHKVCSA